MAKALRKEAERRDLFQSNEKSSKVTRGAFGPTFAGASDSTTQTNPSKEEEEAITYTPEKSTKGKRKAKQETQPWKKRTIDANETHETCLACDGNHQLAKCYYTFLKDAPEHFQERKVIRNTVEHRLKVNASLKNEMEYIKKTNQPEKSQ